MTALKSVVIAGRCQLLPFVALLLLALPLLFTLRNCVAELPERIHQFTAEEVQTVPLPPGGVFLAWRAARRRLLYFAFCQLKIIHRRLVTSPCQRSHCFSLIHPRSELTRIR